MRSRVGLLVLSVLLLNVECELENDVLHPVEADTVPDDEFLSAGNRARGSQKLEEGSPARHTEAYATFVYGEPFVLGVRVLGQSIRESGTDRDMVVIVAGEVRQSSIRTLLSDGWRVKRAEVIHNPALGPQTSGFPAAFWAVYTKLNMFNLVEYSAVLYLDADVIAISNMDDAFQCPGFCAALRHSERFNSGVMKIVPDTGLFHRMLREVGTLTSYTGGDQGFLNAFFPDFANAPVFDPSADYSSSDAPFMRLPTTYNADIGLFVVNSNRWALPLQDIKAVHYTLGPFKPWDWWTVWLVKENWRWDRFRHNLPLDSLGMPHGHTKRQVWAERCLPLIPPVLLAIFAHLAAATHRKATTGLPYSSHPCSSSISLENVLPSHVAGGKIAPPYFVFTSIISGYLCLVAGMLTAVLVVPHEITPAWGWIITYEFVFVVMFILASQYMHVCYVWGCKVGKSSVGSDVLQSHTVAPWRQTWTCTALSVVGLGLLPWVTDLMGINAFATKIIMTILFSLIANTFLTHIFASLATSWFAHGRAETLADSR